MTQPTPSDVLERPIAWRGLAAAGGIIGAWSLLLAALLTLDLSNLHWAWVPLLIALQVFLHTGLFITAHDAMHGTVAPRQPRLNKAVGAIATILYALFSYRKLHKKHHQHHAHPVSNHDPDYHEPDDFLPWYGGFIAEYIGLWQVVGMAAVYNVAHHLLGIPIWNLNLFWVLPSLLSTLQLFYFGTYLPHRHPPNSHTDAHRSTTNDFHPVISFLTCYHFGYHWEHHEYPQSPWWRLPAVRRAHRTAATDPAN